MTKIMPLDLEYTPPTVIPQLESGHAPVDTNHSLTGHSECKSQLNASSQQQKVRNVDVDTKESLADWGLVACVFLSNLIAAIDITGFGVFYPYLVEQFDASTAAVGWCSSANGVFQAVLALFATYPIQSYGCRWPGVVGCLLFSIGMSLSYLAPNLTTIYFTYGVIGGSGSCLAMLSTNIIIHQRFTRNRNLASGIGLLGFSCGGIIGPIVTHQLIQLYNWRGAFLVLGAMYAKRIPLCLFFRTPTTLTSQSNHASGISQRRISGQVIVGYLKETFNFSILRHARFSVYSIAYFFHLFCVYGYLPHTVNRAIHVGLTSDQAVTAATVIGAMSMVTRVPISFIANLPKVKSTLVFAIGMFCAFLSIVAVFINPGIAATMTSAALFGIHVGCTTTVFTNVAVSLMGVALLPKSLAILQFVGGLSKLFSPPLIGWVFDMTLEYNKAFAIIGFLAFVSGSLMVILTLATKCHQTSIARDIDVPEKQEKASTKSTDIEEPNVASNNVHALT